MKQFILLIFTILFSFTLSAQQRITCGAEEFHKELYNTDPVYHDGYDKTKAFLKENKIKNYKTVTTMSGTEYHVPVVVHVIHTGGAVGSAYNPSVATINALITQINNGFANTFNDPNTAGNFNSVDIPIRFYLAQRTENCTATTGINRIDFSSNSTYTADGVQRSSTSPGVPDATIKALAHWNDLDYYNIYIVNKINGVDGNCAPCSYVAGYANYPIVGGTESDGMVCLAWAASNATSTTFIHEMGHGFNLAHPFSGGNTTVCPPSGNCNTDNDEVCDTEPMLASFACNPSGTNACNSMNWNTQSTQWNYMGYSSCTDRFTAGQSSRVLDALNNVRTSLKNSAGVDPPPAALPTAIAPPTINSANSSSNTDMGPELVSFNTIEHTSKGFSFEGSGYNVYVDNTCNQATTIIRSSTYPLSVLTSGNPQKVAAYVDWNNDGVFSNSSPERILNAGTQGGGIQTYSANITPPATAVLNTPLRMRVMADFSAAPAITPTGQLLYGQAEDFTVTVVGAPLPVLWRSITANLNHKNNIDVRWATEMETNSSVFEIEKSKNGKDFFRIGTVEAAGNSSIPLYYNFEDAINVKGYNYYRIKQIDIDGKTSYSQVVTEIINSNETDIVIFPNPTSGKLFINLAGLSQGKNTVNYSITDLNGKVWTTNEVKMNDRNSQFTEDMSAMPAGLYFVQLRINNQLSVHKISKQF